MRTVTVTLNVYKYDELDEHVKNKLRFQYRENEDYEPLHGEVLDTMNAFEKHFSCHCLYQYGLEGVRYARVTCDLTDEEIKERVSDIPDTPCPWTGVCWDEEIIDALRKGETLSQALYLMLESAVSGMQARDEDKYIDGEIRIQELEYLANGEES